MTLTELETNVKDNLSFLENELNPDTSPEPEDIDGIVGHGMQLAALISLAAKCLSNSKLLLNKKELIWMQANPDLWNRATILKKMMEGNLAEYYSYVTYSDRIMAAMTHKMDFYRSVISKYKQEQELNRIQFKQT
jgi:hypothetical protein